MLDLATPKGKIIDAALKLAATEGWAGLSLGQIAAAAGVNLAEFRRHFPTKTHILAAYTRAVDDALLAKMPEATAEDTGRRDRLFDVLMTRFEMMEPYKPGLKRINADLLYRPAEGLALLGAITRSQYWMLAAAGVPADGPRGAVSLPGLVSVYARVFDIWLDDTSEGLAKTMAALDTRLQRGERFMHRLDDLRSKANRFFCRLAPKRGSCCTARPAEPATAAEALHPGPAPAAS